MLFLLMIEIAQNESTARASMHLFHSFISVFHKFYFRFPCLFPLPTTIIQLGIGKGNLWKPAQDSAPTSASEKTHVCGMC